MGLQLQVLHTRTAVARLPVQLVSTLCSEKNTHSHFLPYLHE